MGTTKLMYEAEAYAIRGAVFDVYTKMGNGFEEPIYQECMELALKDRGIDYEAQKHLPLHYGEHKLKHFYQPDLFCYGKIVVELKACAAIADVHRAQLLNYLRLTGCRLGLLVNFGSFPKVTIERLAM